MHEEHRVAIGRGLGDTMGAERSAGADVFSMTMFCLSVALMAVPTIRAMVSPGPPAENGTTIVTGRTG